MKNQTSAVPIPRRMQHLATHKGYPVPWLVYRDNNGVPHFSINEETRRRRALFEDLCSVCGMKLFRGRWFVGGPLCILHSHGSFIDPPMHSECAHYALKVCPYLAAPHWGKEIGVLKVAATAAAHSGNRVFVDNTMMPGRPAGDVLIAVMAVRQRITDNETWNVRPKLPYSVVEYWKHGQRISFEEGNKVAMAALESPWLKELEAKHAG